MKIKNGHPSLSSFTKCFWHGGNGEKFQHIILDFWVLVEDQGRVHKLLNRWWRGLLSKHVPRQQGKPRRNMFDFTMK